MNQQRRFYGRATAGELQKASERRESHIKKSHTWKSRSE